MVPLLASAARTGSGVAAITVPRHLELVRAAIIELVVALAATDAGDTLDVFLQASMDGGTTWNDVVRFTQVLGSGGAKTFEARWVREASPDVDLGAPTDKSMAAGVRQGPVGAKWRVAWVITDAGADNASFTFGLNAALSY